MGLASGPHLQPVASIREKSFCAAIGHFVLWLNTKVICDCNHVAADQLRRKEDQDWCNHRV